MIDWLEKHPLITGLEKLTKGQLVCGTVIQKHPEMGFFVELAGGSALTAPARFIHAKEMSAASRNFILSYFHFFLLGLYKARGSTLLRMYTLSHQLRALWSLS